MSKQLSERETAVLEAVLQCMPYGATGADLIWRVRGLLGTISAQDVPVAGIHRTAASLRRKNLAWSPDGARPQLYKITQTGREALKGNRAGKWIAREQENRT